VVTVVGQAGLGPRAVGRYRIGTVLVTVGILVVRQLVADVTLSLRCRLVL